jgi:hypothetical protein
VDIVHSLFLLSTRFFHLAVHHSVIFEYHPTLLARCSTSFSCR